MTDVEVVTCLKAACAPSGARYVAVYQLLLGAQSRYFTVEGIYASLLAADSQVNFVGVSRIVKRMCLAGIINAEAQKGRPGREKMAFALTTSFQTLNPATRK